MLATLPYADLLAIYNTIAPQTVRRFDTRANGVRRTELLLARKNLTLAEAARLADVVLPGDASIEQPSATTEPAQASDAAGQPAPVPEPNTDADRTVILSGAEIRTLTTLVINDNSFRMTEEAATTLLEKLRTAPLAKVARVVKAKPAGEMTAAQRVIVDLCSRSEGATGKELAGGCGWPAIAARATCQKLAERFGFDLTGDPKSKKRGITYNMTPKATGI